MFFSETQKTRDMNTLLSYKNTYTRKIESCIARFKGIDAKWIKRRSWFNDLNRFDIGENFFERILQATSSSPPDKKAFHEKLVNSILSDSTANELGMAIAADIPKEQKEDHESLLGYLWWIEIYNAAKREKQFTTNQIMELELKRKYFFRLISDMERISQGWSSRILRDFFISWQNWYSRILQIGTQEKP